MQIFNQSSGGSGPGTFVFRYQLHVCADKHSVNSDLYIVICGMIKNNNNIADISCYSKVI